MTLPVVRLAIALFLVQAGFHGYTASLPLALARADVRGRGDRAHRRDGGPRPDPGRDRRRPARGRVRRAAAVRRGRRRVPARERPAPACRASSPAARRCRSSRPGRCRASGIACTLPAALSLVPRMLPKAQTSSGLAFVGAAHNLTLVLLPLISIAVLDADARSTASR